MKMNNEFDFNKIGKQMPYTVPDNFFDDLEKNIMKQVEEESKPRAKRRFLWPTVFSAAAAVACLIVLSLKFMPVANVYDKDVAQSYSPKTAQVEEAQAFDKLSKADQEYLMEVYNDDVFIEEVSN